MSFRPTATQALGRGAYVGAWVGLGLAAVVLLGWALGLLDRLGLRTWLAIPLSLIIGLVGGAALGLVLCRKNATDIDDAGLCPAPRRDGVNYVPWRRIRELRTERRSGRTWVAVYFDTGQMARLRAPYDGRWLGADPEFERKLFMLRNLWETHRSFTINNQFPTEG